MQKVDPPLTKMESDETQPNVIDISVYSHCNSVIPLGIKSISKSIGNYHHTHTISTPVVISNQYNLHYSHIIVYTDIILKYVFHVTCINSSQPKLKYFNKGCQSLVWIVCFVTETNILIYISIHSSLSQQPPESVQGMLLKMLNGSTEVHAMR